MMTNQTEALRMAIEAFDTLMMEKGSVYQKAIQACKEALAETQEPNDLLTYGQSFEKDGKAIPIDDVYYTPKQEPVAYQPTSQEQSVMHQAMIRSSKLVHKATPPSREWVGLSDDEVQKVLKEMWDKGTIPSYSIVKFASAIEAKLREKNDG